MKLRGNQIPEEIGDVACVIRVDEESQSDNDVGANAHSALEVVALSVLNEVVDDQNTEEEDHGLESLEVKGHGLAHDPAKKNHERSDKQRDLHRATNRHVDGQIHLILVGNNDGRDVLCSVSDDGKQNQTNESLGDVGSLDNGVDAVDQVLSANGDDDGDNEKSDTGGNGVQDVLLRLFLLLSLRIEEVRVRLQLEVKVHDVENE